MKTHDYINRTTQEQFRMAHIQVTHRLSLRSLICVLAFAAANSELDIDDDVTKTSAEKVVREILTRSGSEAAIGWHDGMNEDEAAEIREWAGEHARRWWGPDFGS